MAAGLGVTALLGVLILKWQLPRTELVLLVLLCVGIAALVLAAEARAVAAARHRPAWSGSSSRSARSRSSGFFAVRLHGAPGLGGARRAGRRGVRRGGGRVAAAGLRRQPRAVLHRPAVYLLIAHSLVGQLLLGLAMQRGSTTAAVAAMDAAGAVPAALVGLLVLGDAIWPGREWLAAAGFVVTLGSVIGLSFYAEPQHHHPISREAKALVLSGVPLRARRTAGR